MKLGVCVPYRNREEHLKAFIPRVTEYLESRGIDFCMYFAHQCDDKLFNRGATKNIAAKHAFEDGCDYIVWHDIDMLPESGADYSFPEKYPIHIATNISQMNYELKYFEYFGGAVVFSKEQVEKTNGYSNNYWDWGMEDDDLFWRCYLEGLVDTSIYTVRENQGYLRFSGENQYVKIYPDVRLRNFMSDSHTVSILVRAFQQPEKNAIYLIGDKDRRYVEYPILAVPGYDYMYGFNNSKALSCQYWNSFNQHNYMWCKRYDNQWSWLTVTFDVAKRISRMYLNGKEIDSVLGEGSLSPHNWLGRLKMYGNQAIYLGTSPSISKDDPRRFFKGDIAKVQIWRRTLCPEEVQNLHKETPDGRLVLDLDFTETDQEGVEILGATRDVDTVSVYNSILPYRKPGRFFCLPHEDEGIVGGEFKKGDTTARNERRYQLEMQQGKINYKEDGIAQLDGKYELLGIQELTPKAKMINIRL